MENYRFQFNQQIIITFTINTEHENRTRWGLLLYILCRLCSYYFFSRMHRHLNAFTVIEIEFVDTKNLISAVLCTPLIQKRKILWCERYTYTFARSNAMCVCVCVCECPTSTNDSLKCSPNTPPISRNSAFFNGTSILFNKTDNFSN